MGLGAWMLVAAALAGGDDPLLQALEAELDRTMEAWEGAPDAPYYLGYRVADFQSWSLSARYGALGSRDRGRSRNLDVSARVGSRDRDSTHELKGDYGSGTNWHIGQSLPLDADPAALQAVVWAATNKEIRDAQEKWLRVQANQVVKVEDEDPSGDFTEEEPVVDVGDRATLELDLDAWEPVVLAVSDRLDDHPDVHSSSVSLNGRAETQYLVTSEGTRLRHPRAWVRIALQAATTAEDGTEVRLYRWKDVHDPAALPDAETLEDWADELRRDVVEMRDAPSGEPYSGPVLLKGRAAGVFVHEVLGHRSEGHRQKDEDEGHTFKDKVGERVLPPDVSIYDDPTLATYAGEHLNGHYAYDQEGVPAQRAVLVEDGVYRGFLMSRSPIEGFPQSNGHGRAQAWRQPVARMANTIVESSRPVPYDRLVDRLRREVRAQGRDWGLLVDEIGGGFTMTGRVFPNAFNVRAVTAWKVFADGRPHERVRGVDLVGTPLVALSSVAGVGDDPAVFNGFCGAESGSVPNSAVSPSLLLRTLEVQKKEKGAERPPLLPKPRPGGDS